MPINPEQAETLLNSGSISRETYKSILKSNPSFLPSGNSLPMSDPASGVSPEVYKSLLKSNPSFTPSPSVGPMSAPVSSSGSGGISNLLGKVNPIGVIGDVVGKAVDVAQDQLNQQTKTTESKSQQFVGGPGSEAALENVQTIVPAKEAAQRAVSDIAPKEEQYLKLAGEAQAKAAQNILDEQKARQLAIEENAKQANNMLMEKQKTLQDMQKQIAINPQEAINKQVLTNPIVAGISMLLSGIGSGLTGQPNAALEIYHKTLDRAITTRSQNIQGLYQKSQGYGDAAQGFLNKSQATALSQQISAATIYSAAEAYVAGIGNKLQSATAKERAKLIQNDLAIKAQNAANSVAEMTKGFGINQDARRVNALGYMLDLGIGTPTDAIKKTNEQVTGVNPVAPAPQPSGFRLTPEISREVSRQVPQSQNFLLTNEEIRSNK